MTYALFHAVFLLPALVLAALQAKRVLQSSTRARFALAAVCALALLYTTPWDQYLIARGVWTYQESRVLATIGYVPIEEYIFFLLQPLVTGFLFLRLTQGTWIEKPTGPPPSCIALGAIRNDEREARFARSARWIASLFWIAVTIGGAFLLRHERSIYLALILVWAGPVLAGQCFLAARPLVRHANAALATILIATLYLCCADRFAIGAGIWHISERTSTGLLVGGLPVEEAVFFLLTNTMVVQGLLLFLHPEEVRNALAAPLRGREVGCREVVGRRAER